MELGSQLHHAWLRGASKCRSPCDTPRAQLAVRGLAPGLAYRVWGPLGNGAQNWTVRAAPPNRQYHPVSNQGASGHGPASLSALGLLESSVVCATQPGLLENKIHLGGKLGQETSSISPEIARDPLPGTFRVGEALSPPRSGHCPPTDLAPVCRPLPEH